MAQTLVIEKVCRETVDGIEYNVTYLRGEKDRVKVFDPVRTPEQQEKRDRDLREAAAAFGRAMLDKFGEEWFRKHLQYTPEDKHEEAHHA